MARRYQNTLNRVSKLNGFGLFTNSEVSVTFFPAPENHGIVFERSDLSGSPRIPACIDFLASEERRTKLQHNDASVEMTEHILAALAGLQVDNCLIQLNAPELPGCDGSSLQYVEAILDAEIIEQTAPRECLVINSPISIDQKQTIITIDPSWDGLRISYDLNYGPNSPIPPQLADFTITPETFATKIAFARTFVLESEVAYLKSKGYGKKVTLEDLLVYGENGPLGNSLRAPNECARHKLLDCLGDLLLCGCDLKGHIRCFRSGHRQNHLLAEKMNQLRQLPSQKSAA